MEEYGGNSSRDSIAVETIGFPGEMQQKWMRMFMTDNHLASVEMNSFETKERVFWICDER